MAQETNLGVQLTAIQAVIEQTRTAKFVTMMGMMERVNNARGRNEEEWLKDPSEDRVHRINQPTRDKTNSIDKLENVICKSHGVDEYMLNLEGLFNEKKAKLLEKVQNA